MNSNNIVNEPNTYIMENIYSGIVKGIFLFIINKKRRKLFFLDFINVFLSKTQQSQSNR